MAIQPSVRLAGSSHILRFQGNIVAGPTPQVDNATWPATAAPAANAFVQVAFALADLTDTTDTTRRLPFSVFDDSVPAAEAPHNAAAGGPSGADGISAPAGDTWMQNIRVRAQENSATTATPLIAGIRELTPIAAASPGGPTTLPTVLIEFALTAAGVTALGTAAAPGAGIPVVVEIEVPLAATR